MENFNDTNDNIKTAQTYVIVEDDQCGALSSRPPSTQKSTSALTVFLPPLSESNSIALDDLSSYISKPSATNTTLYRLPN